MGLLRGELAEAVFLQLMPNVCAHSVSYLGMNFSGMNVRQREPGSGRLLRGLFEYALFQLFLALNAVARPRHRVQPLGIDFLLTGNALAERTLAHPFQSLLHLRQQLPFVVALVEEKFLGIGTRGLVGNILRGVLIGIASALLR